jgi:hypothetical protein
MSGTEKFRMPTREPLKHIWNMADREAPKMRAGEPLKHCLDRFRDLPKNVIDLGSKEPRKPFVTQR